jgi:DNA processing protein
MFPLPTDPLAQRLLLNALPGVGPATLRRLRDGFRGDLGAALRATPTELARIKGVGAKVAATIAARDFDWAAELARVEALGFRVVGEPSPDWPIAFAALWDPPTVLYAEGAALPGERAVAIVGSRHCTPYGAALARRLARELATEGWWIVSGLARGIDTAAHEGALDAGGRTVAVLGHGLDLTYPPEGRALRARMRERGGVLSEFPLGRPADRQSFPQRNRVVAALARAVVVVETDVDGGSLITARFAGDLGKTLCAVPGRVDSPASRGCHALIRDGATLVSSTDEILRELGEARGEPGLPAPTSAAPAPEHARWLRPFAGGTAHDAESLAEATHCAPAEAAAMLTLLEIRGLLLRRPDGRHEQG